MALTGVILPLILERGGCVRNQPYDAKAADPRDADKAFKGPSYPPRHYVIGFKDRNLEREFIAKCAKDGFYSVIASMSCVLFVLVTTGLVYVFPPMSANDKAAFQGSYTCLDNKCRNRQVIAIFMTCLPSLVGISACIGVYCDKRIKDKTSIFIIAEVALILDIVVSLGLPSWVTHLPQLDYNGDLGDIFNLLFGENSWLVLEVLIYMLYAAAISMAGMPWLYSLELIVFAIVYLCTTMILVFKDHADIRWFRSRTGMVDFCATDEIDCEGAAQNIVTGMVCFLVILAAFMLVSRKLADLSMRKNFVKNLVITAQGNEIIKQSKDREVLLLKQKSSNDHLIHSIFPRTIAKELIRKTEEEVKGENPSFNANISHLRSAGLTFALVHEQISILFTDIVGFTAMSKVVEPYQVLKFLDELYSEFDAIIDTNPNLWKVETIGDSFMAAGGLEVSAQMRSLSVRLASRSHSDCSGSGSVTRQETRIDTDKLKVSKSVELARISYSEPSHTPAASKRDYGEESLRNGELCEDPAINALYVLMFATRIVEASEACLMPNGKPCRVRCGIHTGNVCSGIVGTRMPRYCLFGDTVNTAARMESTSEPGRVQVSCATHELLTQNFEHIEWEDRGEIQVKGKGRMRTYLFTRTDMPLAVEDEGAAWPSPDQLNRSPRRPSWQE